jgi:hypothetical protein
MKGYYCDCLLVLVLLTALNGSGTIAASLTTVLAADDRASDHQDVEGECAVGVADGTCGTGSAEQGTYTPQLDVLGVAQDLPDAAAVLLYEKEVQYMTETVYGLEATAIFTDDVRRKVRI